MQRGFRALGIPAMFCAALFFDAACPLRGQPAPAALSAFDSYCGTVESRLAGQHQSPNAFLAPPASEPETANSRLRRGEVIIEHVAPSAGADFPGALLHHWRGTAFVPGAKAADFERLLRDFPSYPRRFSPQVVEAKVLSREGDRFQVKLRVRQKHIITVVMDTTYDVTFGRLDAHHGYSVSRSTRISEIDSPGTSDERELDAAAGHGFLWRLNTWWSFEDRDGGLEVQIESASLSRNIPLGLGWLMRPFVESIPRESLEFTLRSACDAIRK